MGAFIPENEARAPQTAALLRQMPDVYNAFFSVLEPHQHIDPHWGHYKGYVSIYLHICTHRCISAVRICFVARACGAHVRLRPLLASGRNLRVKRKCAVPFSDHVACFVDFCAIIWV
jgi:Aspartyl/Asparaginyl beta-hydroxylase